MQEEQKLAKTSLNQREKERKISSKRYIVAGIITFLIFSLGLALGSILEEQRYDWAQEVNDAQDVEYLSLQLQYLLLTSTQNQESCTVLSSTLQKSVSDLSESLAKIIDYEDTNKALPEDEIILIERRYALDNIRYYLLSEKASESCSLEVVPILYFYQEKCDKCADQGTLLTYYKKLLGDQVLIFPINTDLKNEEPLVQTFLSLYNIQEYPSIVINGKTHNGLIYKEDLGELICEFQHFDQICKT